MACSRPTAGRRDTAHAGIAQAKAYTLAAFGVSTHPIHDVLEGDPPLLVGIPQAPRLVTFGSGYPIPQNGAVVGAIGVSGGHYTQDMQVAQAGLAALG